jgi:hypothetical protein
VASGSSRSRTPTRSSSRRAANQARPRPVLPRVGDGIVRALYERPTQLKRHPDGARARRSTRSACRRSGPSGSRRRRVTLPVRPHADELCVTELAQVAGRRTSRRSTSTRGRRGGATSSIRTSCASTSTRSRARRFQRREEGRGDRHEVLDEIGYVGWPKTSGTAASTSPAGSSRCGLPRGAPLRARVRARGRAARAEARHDGRGGRRSAASASSSTTTRTRATGRSPRLLGARAARRDRLGAGHVGRAADARDRGLHDGDDAGALRRARRRAGGIDDAVCDLRASSSGSSARRRRAPARRRTRRTSRRCRRAARVQPSRDTARKRAKRTPSQLDARRRPMSGCVRVARRAELAPRALRRLLVVAEADELRPCRKRLPCTLS